MAVIKHVIMAKFFKNNSSQFLTYRECGGLQWL